MKNIFSGGMQDVMTMNTAKEFAEVDMPGNNSTVLKGSCFCGKCRLEATSNTPYPFMVNTVTRCCMASCRLVMNKPTAPDPQCPPHSTLRPLCILRCTAAGLPLHFLSEDGWRLLREPSRREGIPESGGA